MFVAMFSPIAVLTLVAVYGWLVKAPRLAFIHALLQVIWTIWFWSASNHNEVTLLGVSTDYVIWAALVLYVLHSLLILGLVVVQASKLLRASR
jgi:hypothetical protein